MPEFKIEAISRPLHVRARVGRGRDEDELAGSVLAVGWWAETDDAPSGRRQAWQNQIAADPPELFYLVSDPARPAPVWASARNLTEQVSYPGPGRATGSAPSAPVR